MATKFFELTQGAWVKVANGACLVDIALHGERVLVTTQATGTPDIATKAVHPLSTTDARCFSYGGSHAVFARAKENKYNERTPAVVVTGDNLA